MCGIAGQVRFGEPPSATLVMAMADALRHRGPDDQGIWTSSDSSCVLAHRRLSIIDLSPLGHQPMIDPQTGNAIVFNGEIYNFQSLRAECERAGDSFASQSDTEVILALYRRHGVACLQRLRGMFAFALWDASARALLLARDRVGKKPLHYSVRGNSLIFASELLPLSRHPEVRQDMDLEALELYLQLQYIPHPWSIYSDIRKLPPAHYAIWDARGLTVHPYWDVDYRPKQKMSEADALEGLEEALTEAVRLRMISDVPLGALLSGGVDSSLIVALMSRLSSQPVRTFSVGFSEANFNELPFANQAAAICGTDHTTEIVDGNISDLLPLIARHYGEPYADSSAVPSFMVCRTARQHVTVALNGDGGDELLGGYGRYQLSDLQIAMARCIPDMISPATLAALAGRFSGAGLVDRAMRKFIATYAWPESRSITMYGGFFGDDDRRLLLGERGRPLVLPQWRSNWLSGAFRHGDNPIDRLLWQDNRTYLPDDLLVKMDIAAMHVGLETRSPLLDHHVIEFCASLEIEHKVRGRAGKYLLKRLAEKYFPPEFVHRQKMGFAVPLVAWLRGPLRAITEETCRDPAVMFPLHPKSVAAVLDTFYLRGVNYAAPRIWSMLMFGMWKQTS